MLPLILASSSPYRKSLLERLQLPFQSASPDIDEAVLPNEHPEQLTQRLALTKAKALQSHFPAHLIIGSDQVVLLDGQPVSKPENHDEACRQLQRSSGKTLTFFTALCLLNTSNAQHQLIVEPYEVTFRQLSDAQIERYLRCDQPYDCAGSFKSEGFGISLIEHMRGDDPNSLIGLPLIRLCQMLAREGIHLP
ncbi:MAG: nucleoside triphosphate pyrophosphatase [Halopseudomonas sp.]